MPTKSEIPIQSNNSFMAAERVLPSVAQDDLKAFHLRTFGFAASLGSLPVAAATEDPHTTHEEIDDGLGFYADGTKRTLTDEQIAMFRSSEIYGILRAREVARENMEPMPLQDPDHDINKDSSSGHLGSRDANLDLGGPGRLTGPAHGRDQGPQQKDHQRSKASASDDVPSRRVIRQLDNVRSEDHVLDY